MPTLYRHASHTAAALTLCMALLHYLCILWGADGFRFMGAGEAIAKMAENGHWYPTFISTAVGTALLIPTCYALAAARGKPRLPWHRQTMLATSIVFLLRGLAFPLLKPMFPENSDTFWWITSAICLLLGSLYAAISMFNPLQTNTTPKPHRHDVV